MLDIAAVLYSILITSGPWIISSVYLFLTLAIFKQIPAFFLGVVTYSFIFSMVIVGSFSFLLTRYLADLLFLKEYEKISGTYKATLFITFVISTATSGMFFLINNNYNLKEVLLGIYTFVAISVIWIDVAFLEVIENYLGVVLGFLGGFSGAFFLSFILKNETLGLLISFDMGALIV
ncbi:MAG: hypothetical protein J7L34_07885, partial [Thermotogaceae bacterium]|nr:hypothetical protein [Thermotogaceae bacterium]